MPVKFNPEHKAVLDNLLLGHPMVHSGNAFGYPGYYAGEKLCICLFEQGVSLKLPQPSVAKLLETDGNAFPFEPMAGRKMREWVLINLERSEHYRQYRALFDESISFVLAGQGK
jgi:hypothetical protein